MMILSRFGYMISNISVFLCITFVRSASRETFLESLTLWHLRLFDRKGVEFRTSQSYIYAVNRGWEDLANERRRHKIYT